MDRFRKKIYSSKIELEFEKDKLSKILKDYDSGDLELNKNISSSNAQEIENRIKDIDIDLWKISSLKDNGVGTRFINADISDFLNNEKELKSDFNIKLISNKSLAGAESNSDLKNIPIRFYDFIDSYVFNSECLKEGKSLVVTGPTGTGKTHFSVACLLSVLETYNKQMTYTFCQMADIASIILDKDYRSSSKFEKIQKCDFLIVDDMCAEKTWESVIEEIMLRIFRYRYNNNLPIICTTNLSPIKFIGYYGQRHKSVFCSNAYQVMTFVTKQDIRIQ